MSNYLKRFYPLQAAKLWIKSLNNNNKACASNKSTRIKLNKDIAQKLHNNASLVEAVEAIFNTLDAGRQLDFKVTKQISSIPNAGSGIYLKGNTQKPGSILCFYPGTIYLPSIDPIFFVSLSNQYILKCVDGIYIDGKASGLSGRIYSSIYKRENWPGTVVISDDTWMAAAQKHGMEKLRNPLAVGQFVNNHTDTIDPNVYYQEIDISLPEFPNHLKKYLPNMYFNPAFGDNTLRLVALVAMRDIKDGQELFSTYMDLV